jgi:hypothetical protein
VGESKQINRECPRSRLSLAKTEPTHVMETAPETTQPTKLNEVQLMLLKLFNRGMSEQETREIRDVILAHYQKQLQEEVERVIVEKNITREDFERILNESQRTRASKNEGGR